ncbi:MAG: hypothetical protein ABIW76_05975 [Fibrobacteria bacterium]
MKAGRNAAGVFLTALLPLSGCLEQSYPGPKPIVTEGALVDVVYEPARRLVSRSCADCHSQGGHNESHLDAWGHAIRLDTHKQWVDGKRVLLERLDTVYAAEQDPPLDVMPSASFPFQLTREERDTLLQWIARGSPNTPGGDSVP